MCPEGPSGRSAPPSDARSDTIPILDSGANRGIFADYADFAVRSGIREKEKSINDENLFVVAKSGTRGAGSGFACNPKAPERDARSADLLRIAAYRPILDGDGSPGPSNTAVVAPAPDDPEPVDSSPKVALAKRREIGVRVIGCPARSYELPSGWVDGKPV